MAVEQYRHQTLHVEARFNPDPDLAALYRIFDDKRHPFYEHRLAA